MRVLQLLCVVFPSGVVALTLGQGPSQLLRKVVASSMMGAGLLWFACPELARAEPLLSVSTLQLAGFLPSREDLPLAVSIPRAITTLHPLPQEELIESYSKANALLSIGKFDSALEEANKAVAVGPGVSDVFVTRGIIYEKLLDWDAAIADYQQAQKLRKRLPFERDDATIVNNLANAEAGAGRWEQSLLDFERAASLAGARGEAFYAPELGAALVKHQLGRVDEATDYFRTLVAKFPLFPDGLAALSVMEYEKQGQVATPEVLDLWDRATREDNRYKDRDWVENVRRWPPSLVKSLASLELAAKAQQRGL